LKPSKNASIGIKKPAGGGLFKSVWKLTILGGHAFYMRNQARYAARSLAAMDYIILPGTVNQRNGCLERFLRGLPVTGLNGRLDLLDRRAHGALANAVYKPAFDCLPGAFGCGCMIGQN
jgi:hypothetical protein